MLLDNLLDISVVQSIPQVFLLPFIWILHPQQFCQLLLDSFHDFADLSLGYLDRDLFNVALTLDIGYFMLGYFLLHYEVIELNWVFIGDTVVKLTFFRLNYVGLAWGRCVLEAILLGTVDVLAEDLLVLEG